MGEATSVPEVKALRDKTEAIRLFSRQPENSHDAQNKAAELQLPAERHLGELLRDTKRHHPDDWRPSKASRDERLR